MPDRLVPLSLSQLLSLALCLFVTAVSAADEEEQRWYDIEILIFSQGDEKSLMDEVWPAEVDIADLDGAIELQRGAKLPEVNGQGSHLPQPFQLLAPETYQLTDAALQLKRSKNHRVLLHAAWRQPGLADGEAKSVHISDRINDLLLLDSPVTNEGIENESTPPPTVQALINIDPETDLFALAENVLPHTTLDGTIKVVLSRYLHLHADLRYNYRLEEGCQMVTIIEKGDGAAGAPQAIGFTHGEGIEQQTIDGVEPAAEINRRNLQEPCYQTLSLSESRRMRSNELHLLDHPLFGMLVVITQYELPEADEQTAPSTGKNIN
jgi:hypothetical protein